MRGFQCVGNLAKWLNENLRQRGLAHHDHVEDYLFPLRSTIIVVSSKLLIL